METINDVALSGVAGESYVIFPQESEERGEVPLRFDTHDHGDPGDTAPIVRPWKRVILDPDYGGHWIVTGDVDGDSAVDIVSSENVNRGDVHYTSTAVVPRLDGSVIWRWGDPGSGRKEWLHDVACQIYDWDGDGKNINSHTMSVWLAVRMLPSVTERYFMFPGIIHTDVVVRQIGFIEKRETCTLCPFQP